MPPRCGRGPCCAPGRPSAPLCRDRRWPAGGSSLSLPGGTRMCPAPSHHHPACKFAPALSTMHSFETTVKCTTDLQSVGGQRFLPPCVMTQNSLAQEAVIVQLLQSHIWLCPKNGTPLQLLLQCNAYQAGGSCICQAPNRNEHTAVVTHQ